MKYLIAILLCLSLFSCKKRIDSPLRSIETGVNYRINDIYFVNENKGFAVGGDKFKEGYILRTLDGGNTWQKLNDTEILLDPDEALQTLYSIDFYSETIGQIVGFNGKILRTENGGNTWNLIINGRYDNFSCIEMLGEQKTIITTFQANTKGQTYTSSQFWYFFDLDSFAFPLQDVFFINENIGFLAGFGSIQKTIDGGDTWSYTEAKGDYFFDLDFPIENTGYACGWQGGIYKTSDQGKTWETVKQRNQVFSSRQHYENIDFISENKGAVCGYRGEVLITNDGGKTWQKIITNISENFYSIKFIDENRLFVGGENGVLLEISVP